MADEADSTTAQRVTNTWRVFKLLLLFCAEALEIA
jgi:hypothetical protein